MSVLCPFHARFMSFFSPDYVLVEQKFLCYNWNRREQQKRNVAFRKRFSTTHALETFRKVPAKSQGGTQPASCRENLERKQTTGGASNDHSEGSLPTNNRIRNTR